VTVNEQEWLACENPGLLLRHLKAIGATRCLRGERRRRLRLLGCAAFGPIRHLLLEERGRRAIDLAERYADGGAEEADLLRLGRELREAEGPSGTWSPQTTAEHVVQVLLLPNDLIVAELALEQAVWPLEWEAAPAKPNLFRKALRRGQAPLVRDIFGNPFSPPRAASAWRTSTVVALARGIYEERGFDRLPILADALEEAGCEDADVLVHGRSSGPHVLGCWVVDCILGKE
jgi:hypothetical protein